MLRRGCLPLLGLLALLGPQPGQAAEKGEARACMRLFESRGYEEAQGCFAEQVVAHPGEPLAMAYMGRTYLARRRPGPAIEWLEQAVAREPGRSELHDWLGQAYGIAAQRAPVVRQFGLASKARKQFERAVELDAGNLDACEDLIEYEIQAPPFLGGSFEKARRHAAELARRDRARGRLAHAAIALRERGLPAAERELLAAAAELPGDPRPQVALGTAYARAGRYDRALDAFEAALRLDAENAGAPIELARAAVAAAGAPGAGPAGEQRLDRAEELLQRYLERVPPGDGAALADGHLGLGALFEQRGDLARARAEVQAALRGDPESPAARRALQHLSRAAPKPKL